MCSDVELAYNGRSFYIKSSGIIVKISCSDVELKKIRDELYKDKTKKYYSIQDINKNKYEVSREELEVFCYIELTDVVEYYIGGICGSENFPLQEYYDLVDRVYEYSDYIKEHSDEVDIEKLARNIKRPKNNRLFYIKNLDFVIETESSEAEMVSLRKMLDEENKSSYEIQDINKNKYIASKKDMELFYL